jgi:transcription termination factor Rho
MVEQQLERSILERKERDELHAIAAAMALTPAPRLKKAEIIDLILEATGVDVVADGETDGNGATADASPTPLDGAATPGAGAIIGEKAATAVAVASPAEDVRVADSSPDGELSFQNDEVVTPRQAPRFAAPGDSPATGDEDADDLRPRPNDRRPPRGGTNRDSHQQGDGHIDTANRRSRRRRGRERGDVQQGQEVPWQGELVPVKGLLDLRDEGYGFLRTGGYLPSTRDVYVSVSQARRLALRRGDAIEGGCRPAGPSEKYPALIRVDSVSGLTPDEARQRPRFEDLTPLFPDSQLRLELLGDPKNVTARIVDLVSPIGRGQRGMIVSPPKAGKTYVMKQIAHSIEANDPDVHLIVLLIAERPEEVTDMRRTVRGEVIASTFDRPADEHTAVAELTIERAKRLVELGRDVVILLDGITRLARAYNLAQPATGRIMSGGVDSGALYPPKRFFGAARNVEEGGSLTILATALVETGSKMDEVIFEEFKGTGNMELRLDRRLAERRIYPAIDVNASSTRHEELLFDRNELPQVWKLRRVLNALSSEGNSAAGLELLMDKIRTTASNEEFLAEIAKAPQPTA